MTSNIYRGIAPAPLSVEDLRKMPRNFAVSEWIFFGPVGISGNFEQFEPRTPMSCYCFKSFLKPDLDQEGGDYGLLLIYSLNNPMAVETVTHARHLVLMRENISLIHNIHQSCTDDRTYQSGYVCIPMEWNRTGLNDKQAHILGNFVESGAISANDFKKIAKRDYEGPQPQIAGSPITSAAPGGLQPN